MIEFCKKVLEVDKVYNKVNDSIFLTFIVKSQTHNEVSTDQLLGLYFYAQ